MNAKSNLKSLLGGKTLVLRGESSGHGVAYTAQEKALAQQILSGILPAANIDMKKPQSVSAEINETILLAAQSLDENSRSVAGIAKAAFRAYTKTAVEGKVEGFPKLRDPTSIQLLMRGAMLELGVAEGSINDAFKRYGKKTTKTA